MTKENRLKQIASMNRAYPSLHLVSGENAESIVWEGWLQPVRSFDNPDALLDDLENDREVEIIHGDKIEIVHDSACKHVHNPHRLAGRITSVSDLFKIRIEVPPDGLMPTATILDPPIPPTLRRHTWGENGACPYAPWKYPWNSGSSSVVEFVNHVLIWRFKWNVYSDTGEWLGNEEEHDDAILLKGIKACDQCYCGSGQAYEACHRVVNGKACFGDNWIYLEAWLMNHHLHVDRFEKSINRIDRMTNRLFSKAAGA
jgi:hypothetical protein